MGEMPMPKRTPEHDKLNFMVGEWKTREVHSPSPWMPQGGTGEGTSSIKWGLGKMALIHEYRSKGAMGAFEGHGVETYDADKKVFVHTWFDSMKPSGMTSHGHIEGKDLIYQTEMDTPQGKMKMKMVTHPVSEKEYTFTINMEMGGKWVPGMTITYVKA